METLTCLRDGRGGGCVTWCRLACPGLEIQPEPGVLAGARSLLPAPLGAWRLWGEGSQHRCPNQVLVPQRRGEADRSNQGKEAGAWGSGGLSQRSRWSQLREVTSRESGSPVPPVLSARGPSPLQRLLLPELGGPRWLLEEGSWRPCGLGGSEGREGASGQRPAAAALDLSFLSIQHLTKKQINQHPRSWTAMLPARLWVLAPLCSSCVCPWVPSSLLGSASSTTHLTSAAAHGGPQVCPYRLSSRPRLPLLPLGTRDQPTYPSPPPGP